MGPEKWGVGRLTREHKTQVRVRIDVSSIAESSHDGYIEEQTCSVKGTSFEEAWSVPQKVAAEPSFWFCFSREGTLLWGYKT